MVRIPSWARWAGLRDVRIARELGEGVPAAEPGRGLADEIALARRESATHGSHHVGLASVLVEELPRTLYHLGAGTVSEWGATVLARETAVLDPEDRRRVDEQLDARLATMTPRQIERAARSLAQAIDATTVVRRRSRAKADRRVSIRPQPDTMTSVTALLPVEQGVAAWAALRRDAETLKASGDGRGLGQLMADLFVERLTGQPRADHIPVEIQLVMAPGSLLGVEDTPATLPGHGPLPADLARELVADAGAEGEQQSARAWLRRIFTDDLGRVVSVDPHRRRFPTSLRRVLRVRDEVCRFPFCDAPIRHDDHVVVAAVGGDTTAANGQGLCARHNQTKSLPGWLARPVGTGPSPEVVTRTPTAHRYLSPVPPVLDGAIRVPRSHVEMDLAGRIPVDGTRRPPSSGPDARNCRPHLDRPPDLIGGSDGGGLRPRMSGTRWTRGDRSG